MSTALDDSRYLAFVARDARFDGQFFVAVKTTGIFCRPVCTVRKPLRRNVSFYPSAAAAFAAGFRPCLRCRPELAPGLVRTLGASSYLQRALHLIDDGLLDHAGTEALAARIGVSDRHLRRLFDEHLGAAPIAVAQARRLLFAKQLIEQSRLPFVEIAQAAGYATVRRFNAALRAAYGRTPTQLRGEVAPASTPTIARDAITLTLGYLGAYDWPAAFAYLAARCWAGVEIVDANALDLEAVDGPVWRRAFVIDGKPGYVEVGHTRVRRALKLAVRTPALGALSAIVASVRRVFDLDADLPRIEAALAQDALFAQAIAARPGLRVPGAWAPFEIAVRAILGQQVSVAAATTLAARLVQAHGAPLAWENAAPRGLSHAFPEPRALADAPLEDLGIVRTRAAAIRSLARVVADAPEFFTRLGGLDEAVARLSALPGIGAWTAQYIAMRGLSEPDAFPDRDLGLMRAFAHAGHDPKTLADHAQAWRPWRAYAAMRLWHHPID